MKCGLRSTVVNLLLLKAIEYHLNCQATLNNLKPYTQDPRSSTRNPNPQPESQSLRRKPKPYTPHPKPYIQPESLCKYIEVDIDTLHIPCSNCFNLLQPRNNSVLFADASGGVYRLNLADGSLLWKASYLRDLRGLIIKSLHDPE